MPRTARIAPGGIIHHVLNRGIGKTTLFRGRREFETFQQCLVQSLEASPMRVLAYCVMPTHWHLVIWPRHDGELATFMMRLSITHVRRWLINRQQVGAGHVYQGRYKSFAIQDGAPLATVCRFVERNPLRAGLAKSSVAWPWSSAGQTQLDAALQVDLDAFPTPRRSGWRAWVERPQLPAEEAAMVRCINENRPFGDEKWLEKMRKKFGWREPLARGRPRKKRV